MLLQKYLQVLTVNNILGLNVLTVFRNDYIAVVDIDEVILPLQHNNWNDLIREIKRKTPETSDNITSFVFRHVLFLDEKEVEKEVEEEEDIPEWLHMMRQVYRSARYFPLGHNVKSLHGTERTEVVHNHYGLSCLRGPCRPHHVDTGLAQLNHYRREIYLGFTLIGWIMRQALSCHKETALGTQTSLLGAFLAVS